LLMSVVDILVLNLFPTVRTDGLDKCSRSGSAGQLYQ
jgi:hypothetical protein